MRKARKAPMNMNALCRTFRFSYHPFYLRPNTSRVEMNRFCLSDEYAQMEFDLKAVYCCLQPPLVILPAPECI